jgi:hypothetical protein
MINRVGKMFVAAMSLCMIVLIVTRKRGDGRYYFALFLFCFVFCFLVFVGSMSCSQCCLFLWIVHARLPLHCNTGTTNKPGVNQGTRHSIDAPETTLDTPRERLKQENRKKTKQLLIL